MYFDDSLTLLSVEIGVLLVAVTCKEICYMVRLQFGASNNMVEYEALIVCVWIAGDLEITRFIVKGDS
jgi:ribonuclease HI